VEQTESELGDILRRHGICQPVRRFHFPTDTWVNFKLFGTMGLMLAFVVLQGLMLAKYAEEKEGK